MDCKEFRDNMFAFQDDALSPERKQAIFNHLDSCNECAVIFREFQLALATVDSDKAAEPNPFASTRILQHIESHLEKRSRFMVMTKHPWIIRPVVVALSLAIGVFIGINRTHRTPATGIQQVSESPVIQSLKTEFFITDFIDEDKSFTIYQ